MGMDDVGYLRISKDRVGAGLGVERQRHDITKRAAADGVTIERWYMDNDMSAYRRRKPRKDYAALMADIASGAINPGGKVWSWHTDRLHRNNAELEGWISLSHPRSIAVMTVKAGMIDLATPAGRMVARQLGAVAQYESEHKGERLKGKMEELARNGKYRGGPRPFGYERDGLTLRKVESDLILAGVEAIIEGEASLNAVCRAWNEAGAMRTVSGKPWQPNLVRNVLCRPRNAGLMELRGEVVGAGEWTAIITEEQHHEVARILRDPKRRTSAGNQPRWLGAGFYLCGLPGCGHSMIVGASGCGTGRKPTYTCAAGRRGAAGRIEGRHVARQAEALDDYIGDLIVEYLSDPVTKAGLQPHKTQSLDRAALNQEIKQIESDQNGLADDVVAGLISREQMHRMNAGYQARLADIERILADAAMGQTQEAKMAMAGDVRAAWDSAPLEVRRAILRELMVVTVLPSPKGQRSFLPEFVDVAWVDGDSSA